MWGAAQQDEAEANVEGGDPIPKTGNPRPPLVLLVLRIEVPQDIFTNAWVSEDEREEPFWDSRRRPAIA